MRIADHLFHYFEKVGTKINYLPNQTIYMQEDDANQLYLIISGRVRVYLISKEGQEITLDMIEKGRIFGESSFMQNSSRPVNVSAIDHVQLISCKLEDLYPYLMESKELTVSILQLMSHTCDYLTDLVRRAYFYNRHEKVAAFLLEHYSKLNNKDLPLLFSHEQISCITGLSRVTVTKILNEFSNSGLILLAYCKIFILNEQKLMDLLNYK